MLLFKKPPPPPPFQLCFFLNTTERGGGGGICCQFFGCPMWGCPMWSCQFFGCPMRSCSRRRPAPGALHAFRPSAHAASSRAKASFPLFFLYLVLYLSTFILFFFLFGNKQIYHQLFLSTLPPVQVLESPSFQKVQRAEPTPAQPLNLHHLPHSLRGHAEDYLGGGEKWGAPVPRTRSPHTLKLR